MPTARRTTSAASRRWWGSTPTRLDPHFIAMFVRADALAAPVANTHSALTRDDVRRCRVPRLPLAEQHRYGEAFRLLLEMSAAAADWPPSPTRSSPRRLHSLTTGALAPTALGERGTIRQTAPQDEREENVVTLPGSGPTHTRMAGDIWSVADLLRGDYKRHEYGGVILPFTLLRRLDAVMAPTRQAVWARDEQLPDIQNKQRLLEKAARLPFYNISEQDFATIAADAGSVAKNLRDYINGFSPNVREILAQFTARRRRSPGWPARSSSTRWSAGSPRCATWTSCPTTRWATCSSS